MCCKRLASLFKCTCPVWILASPLYKAGALPSEFGRQPRSAASLHLQSTCPSGRTKTAPFSPHPHSFDQELWRSRNLSMVWSGGLPVVAALGCASMTTVLKGQATSCSCTHQDADLPIMQGYWTSKLQGSFETLYTGDNAVTTQVLTPSCKSSTGGRCKHWRGDTSASEKHSNNTGGDCHARIAQKQGGGTARPSTGRQTGEAQHGLAHISTAEHTARNRCHCYVESSLRPYQKSCSLSPDVDRGSWPHQQQQPPCVNRNQVQSRHLWAKRAAICTTQKRSAQQDGDAVSSAHHAKVPHRAAEDTLITVWLLSCFQRRLGGCEQIISTGVCVSMASTKQYMW